MSKRSLRTLAVVAGLALVGLAGFAPGCKKEQESLVIIDMEAADANGASVAFVEISIGQPVAVTKIFDLPSTGLPMGSTFEVGVWVPAGVTGSLPVLAVAKPNTGCQGYSGSKAVKINAGETKTMLLVMRADSDVCHPADGGTGGTGGGGPSCGTSVGAPPAVVAAPTTLASCTEFDHQPGAGCVPVNDVDNLFVNDVAVSPDGQLLATAATNSSFDGSVRIWHLVNNVPMPCGPVFSRPSQGPALIAFSPDGKLFAIAWQGYFVDVYRVPDFSMAGEIQSSPRLLYGVGFSADSQTVLSMDWDGDVDGTLYADRPDGTAITQIPLGVDPDFLATSPTAIGGVTFMAVAGYSGNIGFYSWNGSALTGPTIRPTLAGGHGSAVRFSRNGMMLAEGTDDGSIRFWTVPISATSVPTGATITTTDIPFGLSFAPAGDFISVGVGGEFDVWNVSTRALTARRALTVPAGATGQFGYSSTFSASGGALIGGEEVCGKFLICTN